MTKRLILYVLALAVAHASEPRVEDFCCILWVGDSLSDVVRDSEGGQMPSQEEFNGRALTGDTQNVPDGRSDSEGRPDGQDSESAPTVTPPRAPDAGGPGRVLAPPATYIFMGWTQRGVLLGGMNFDTAEECETRLEQDRVQHPLMLFSACAEMRAERETL